MDEQLGGAREGRSAGGASDAAGVAGAAEGEAKPGGPLPAVTKPKGGGAIRGIGEKFDVSPSTGTGTLSVPLVSAAGRSGFAPQLSLSYDSGAGNGPFGLGWSLGLPAISRKTDTGLPRYADAGESDVFVLSGSEELVPVLDAEGERLRVPRKVAGVEYEVASYRPRIEGNFSRIERWVERKDGSTHWRTISGDNVTTLFGLDEESRIYDPDDPRRAFTFLISRSFDATGNAIVYDYVREDAREVDLTRAHEANRSDAARIAQRYLKAIRYGNAKPFHPSWDETAPATPLPKNWHFKIVFDYGDHDEAAPTPKPDRVWTPRPDPFSVHRAGFEVRTYRRCERVLLFHDFPEEEVGADCLVRSTDLAYSDETAPLDPSNPVYTFVESVTQRGYRRRGAGYLSRSLPPLEFEYSQARIDPEVRTLDPGSGANLPRGIAGGGYRSVDLEGEGLAGILVDSGGDWFYKPNLSPLGEGARFGPLEAVDPVPSSSDPRARTQLLDLAGDGRPDAVSLAPEAPGFFERTPEGGWDRFQPLERIPQLDWTDSNLRFVDVTGDGRADVLIAEDACFRVHRSLGEEGYDEAELVPHPLDEEQGPRLVFEDGTSTVFLADMCGDGLVDLVRIRAGEICYWPNLGYGRFGPKVTMDNAPALGSPESFDPKQLHLADVDGSGTADLVFERPEGVLVCFNRSGNSWGEPELVASFPGSGELGSLEVTDLLGTGTACLVWSSPLPGDASASLRYVDLMGGEKPHLMVASRNNLGAETRLTYAPSTRFMLEDERDGRPWATRLPFPVHVVERVETYDWIGRGRFVNRYAYHHGYFDGEEREFRGFGMVERWDTEEHREDTAFGATEASNWDAASWSPPVLERTWFHTGAYLEGEEMSRRYAGEYWVEPDLRAPERAAEREAMLLADTVLDPEIAAAEAHEACRALKGMMLRKEVFALDDGEREQHPYAVSEQSFEVRRLQGRGINRNAVFQAHPRETLSFDYERRPQDPRVTHTVTLAVDGFGNPLASAAVAYPRRPGFDDPEPELSAEFQAMLAHDQTRLHLSLTENEYTEALVDPAKHRDAHRLPLPAGSTVAELSGFEPAAELADVTNVFGWGELKQAWDEVKGGAHDVPYEEIPAGDVDGTATAPGGPGRRIVERTRIRYRRDDLTALLPFGDLQPLALPGVAYRLALTPGLVERLLGNRAPDALPTEAGYVQLPGSEDWWIPGERVFYSADASDAPAAERAEALAHFFVSRRSVDGLGAESSVSYDDYDLLLSSATDPVGNLVTVANDYRAMGPRLITDPNDNGTETAFDALGLVCGTAAKGSEGEGDSLAGFEPDLDEEALLGHFADPYEDPAAALGKATGRVLYDVFAYHRTREDPEPAPPAVYELSRDTHGSEATGHQHAFAYSDGFGREIQRKVEAEAPPGGTARRWVGSGWTIFDNKGNPVRNFEPFFSATHEFEFAHAVGVASTLLYDPLGRVVATLHPDSTWEKSVFDNWHRESWDPGDTVLGRDEKGKPRPSDPRLDPDVGDRFRRLLGSAPGAFRSWHEQRAGGAFGSTPEQRLAEQDAAAKAEAYFETPSVAHLDSAGRTCLQVSDDGDGNRLPSRVALDAEDKPLAVFDSLGRRVLEYVAREPRPGGGFTYLAGYAVAGFGLYRNGMDGGERRMFADVNGNPIRGWDEIGRAFRSRYDDAGRPTHRYVNEPGAAEEVLFERLVYGEGMADRNLCGRLYRQYDEAGLSASERYDFKDNLAEASRQLLADHRPGVDWSALEDLTDPEDLDAASAPLLSAADRFVSTTLYDAHDRVVQAVTPHGGGVRPNVVRPSYGRGGLTEKVDVWIRPANAPADLLDLTGADLHAVTAVEHNARGQRTRLALGNGTETVLAYDALTFKLARLTTTRSGFPVNERIVQDLSYTYDPAGNITRIRDDADIQNVVFFRNKRVDPTMDFRYDALYRLAAARGREHLGQNGGSLAKPAQPNAADSPRAGLLHPGDGRAMDTYEETYSYDLAGNLEEVVHQVSSGAWRRRHAYAEPSLIDPAETSNRLTAISLPGDPAKGPFSGKCEYDAHGNALRMPDLPALGWDAHDRLRSSSRQVVNAGTPETTFYCYDGGGQRLRKATDRQAAAGAAPRRRSERIYLGPVELYREYGADGTTVTLARETLHVELEGLRVAMVETRTAGADPGPPQLLRYQYANHFGSACLELDAKAAVITYEEYHPYGSTSYQAVRDTTETPKRYRWSGKERDEESGLYYHGARYFAPWLGRWASPDPIGVGDGANLYAYSKGNPIRMHDPGGTSGAEPEESFASLKPTVDDLNQNGTKFDPTDRAKNDPSIKSGPVAEGGDAMTKQQAKNHHHKQTSDYRQQNGMSGAEVQAGHTAAKRHVGESGISAKDWDKQPMQQLHSRKGQGLDVEVTDPDGTKVNTRHTSQEKLINQNIETVKKANGGTLTPQGQLDAAAQVEWQTQGTGMDQREVEAIRKSGPAKPTPVDKSKLPVKEEAKAATSEAKAVSAEAKALKTEAKALKAEVKAVEKLGKGAKVMGKLAKAGRHAMAAIPIAGIVAGQASAAYSVSEGDYVGAAMDEAGFIPVVGDLLDAGRAGVAVGEALDEGLGISDVASEHGFAVEGAAKKLGLGEDTSRVLGAIGAGVSSITIAPKIAADRMISSTISGWLK